MLNEWNYDMSEMPKIGQPVILNFSNGIGTDSRYPYRVESIEVSDRGDYKVWILEGRRILKNGSLKPNAWFKVYFKELV